MRRRAPTGKSIWINKGVSIKNSDINILVLRTCWPHVYLPINKKIPRIAGFF